MLKATCLLSEELPSVCAVSSRPPCSVGLSRCLRPSGLRLWTDLGGSSWDDRLGADGTTVPTRICSDCVCRDDGVRRNAWHTWNGLFFPPTVFVWCRLLLFIPGMLVVSSGVAAKMFAGIFVSVEHGPLPTDGVPPCRRTVTGFGATGRLVRCDIHAVLAELRRREGTVVLRKPKLGWRGVLPTRHVLQGQTQRMQHSPVAKRKTPFSTNDHVVYVTDSHTCIFVMAADRPCSAADWTCWTAAPTPELHHRTNSESQTLSKQYKEINRCWLKSED